MRYTPEVISKLNPGEVFVFGSNESGIHGGGAARFAFDHFGAIYGNGYGPQGQCFAIPTKDWFIDVLDLETIATYVNRFINYAINKPKQTFIVTKLGCGLAGWTVEDIAPLFQGAKNERNIILPKEFADLLK